jgi:hypothetical protein
VKIHGSDGIPLRGHEAEYAAELWLEGPSAFWLHPEGPLSETTPEEWLAKQEAGADARRELETQKALADPYAQSLLALARHGIGLQSGLSQAHLNALAQQSAAAQYQAALNARHMQNAPLASLLGLRLF